MATIYDYNTTLNANFKNVYADTIENLIPEYNHCLRDIKFVPAEKQQGGLYVQPVQLSYAHGMTYASSGTVPALNAAVTATYKQAQVEGFQTILREQISYDVAARAASNQHAFFDATEVIVRGMRLAHTQKLEAEMLYGQNNWGVVNGAPVGNVLTLLTGEFAAGLWVGSEGMPIDIYTAAGAFVKTVEVVSVNLDARTLTVSNAVGINDTDVLLPKGAFGNQMAGIHKILTNTGSLFNLSATTYNLWRAVQVSGGGVPLTFARVLGAAGRAVTKGMMGDIVVYVNPGAFKDLVNEIEGARNFGGDVERQYSAKGTERGMISPYLKFHYHAGTAKIVSHPMIKEGYAYGLIMDGSWRRIGASDVTFRIAGRPQEQFFLELENTAGYELRSFSDFAVFCSRPAANFIIGSTAVNGYIVNSTP